MVRSTRVEQNVEAAAADGARSNAAPAPLLQLGGDIALATETAQGAFEWWAGRVQQMRRKSNGKTGKYVPASDPIDFDEAVSTKVKVVCKYYRKHNGYEFTSEPHTVLTAPMHSVYTVHYLISALCVLCVAQVYV